MSYEKMGQSLWISKSNGHTGCVRLQWLPLLLRLWFLTLFAVFCSLFFHLHLLVAISPEFQDHQNILYRSCYSCRSNIDRTRLILGASRERAREQRKLGTQFTPSVVACLKATNNSTEIVTSSWTMWVDFLRAGQERNPNAAPCFLGMTQL